MQLYDRAQVQGTGQLEEIKDEPVLVEFRELCKQHNIKTMLSMMSMTGAINVGPKSFALSFATEKRSGLICRSHVDKHSL